LRCPAFSGFFIDKIKVNTITWPALSNKRLTILVLDIEFFGDSFSVDMVGLISLDVRISNGNKVTAILDKSINHARDIRIKILIPSEISASISMINIKSDGIARNFMFIELLVDMKNILLINIRPSALMIAKSEKLGHSTVSKDIGSGLEMRGIIMADKDVTFKVTSFTEPESISFRSLSVNVDISIGSILPIHGDKAWRILLSADNDGDSAVKGVFGSNGISRDILVVESVRKILLSVFKEEISGSFRKSVEELSIEGEVTGEILIEFERSVSIDFEEDFFGVVSCGV
jgi:hypothetical protein